jgi:hypothetical protein
LIQDVNRVDGGDILGQSNINRGRERRHKLRECAVELAEQRSTRTPAQQLKLLDDRLGVGVGAVKERDRLAREIEQSSNKKRSTKKAEQSVESKPKGKSPKAKDRRQQQRATNKK